MTVSDFALAMNTHFYAPLFCTMAVLPNMRARQFGRIVNISSIGGLVPVPHLSAYVASKFALTGLSQSLRTELLKDNIFVTTVNPGLMRTGSARNALFKGRHVEEYEWFKMLDSLPVTSISANRAAAQIIDAFRHGQANLTISLQAKLAAKVHGLFPSLTGEIGALLNYLLPPPGGIGSRRARGADSESSMTKSPLTRLTDEAAMANNEIR
jgi:short-subunit dehydrogenase